MNLWTNTEQDDQSITGATEVGRDSNAISLRRSSRRLTDRALLSLLRNWLMQDYVAPYCQTLSATRIFRRCYWVDNLGGYDAKSLHIPPESKQATSTTSKQRSKKNTQTQPSALQPLLALTQTLAQASQPIAFNGLLLVSGSGNKRQSKSQKTATAALSIPKESGIVSASWSDIAPTLLQEIEHSPAIFILDPLSPQPFSSEELSPLYQRTIPTELCFVIAHKLIEARLQAASRSPEQATRLTAFLRSNRWKALPATGDEAINGFLDLFIASMQRHFQWSPQRINLPIQNGAASTTHIPYTLIYATRRQDSLLIMNDAFCCYQRRTYQQSYRGVLSEEWFAQQQQHHQAEDLQHLSQQIQQQGTTLRSRRWPELRQQIILSDFGHFMRQEYDQCLIQLIDQQHVRCMWRQAPSEPEKRIPDSGDTLIWQ
jgi:hypothetical protein